MIRPVRIHGIFETVDKSVNNKGLTSEEWLTKKAIYMSYLNSLHIVDKQRYKRLLEEFDDGLIFNIEFKFLMYDLGFGEEEVERLVNKFDAGEKPYGTNDQDLDRFIPNKVSYVRKANYLNTDINPSDVVTILSTPMIVPTYEKEEGIRRGR